MTGPVRVVFVQPDLRGGGAQRVMLNFAASLDTARFETRFVVIGHERDCAVEVSAGLRLDYLEADRILTGSLRLVRTLRASSPQVVVSAMGYLNLALLALRPFLPRKTAILVREANVIASTVQGFPPWVPAKSLYRNLYPLADAVIAPSRSIAEEVIAVAPGAGPGIAILPNPVDEEGLRRRATPVRREPGTGLRLVCAGRLVEQKGFDRLIACLPALTGDWKLAIYGEGCMRAELERQVAARGLERHISFPGFVTDLPARIAGADAFLLPSRWEGLPNAVLEALAVGTPVIASGESGVEDLAQLAGKDVITVCEAGEEFAAAIASAKNHISRGGRPRRSLLPREFRMELAASRLAGLIESVASRRQQD